MRQNLETKDQLKNMINHNPLRILNIDSIANCVQDLNTLAPDTEAEFLTIGKELNDLAGLCYSMTDNAVKLSTLSKFDVNNDSATENSFIEENTKIFDEVISHVKLTITSLGGGENLLTDLRSQMKKLQEPIQRLRGIGKTFRVLGVGIKIESSRVAEGMQGFNLLAGEVADIATLVQDNCLYCLDKADLVENDILFSLQVLKNSDTSYEDSGEQAIYNILHSLEDIGLKSDDLAAGLQERSTVMFQGISDVVMAMQFHDITRQQLENVSSALLETIEKASTITTQDTIEATEQVALEIYSILTIQIAHLNSIYEQIRSAKLQIENGLEKTMDQANIQAQDAKMLLEIEGPKGNKSIVANLEIEIDNIVASLNTSLKSVKQAAKVSRHVYDNVLEIGNFVNSIEEIAFDVKILAINAMVEALKTDEAGSALTVLAKELSNLSQETRDGANDSIAMLENITKGTEKQLEFSSKLDQSGVVVDEMINNAKDFTGKILSLLQDVSQIGQQMDNSSRTMSSRITQLVPGIKFPQVLGDRIDKNWQVICETIDQIEEAYPQFKEGSPEVKQMLEKLAQQYVMERERSIHAQVAGGALDDTDSGEIDLFEDDGFELFDDDTDNGQESGETKTKEEEFDDNIELF